MLNHSCAPNTVNMVVGSSMMVRASEQLPKGSEITTSYLGELAAAPVSARQQALKGAYGFSCNCRRCQVRGNTTAASPDAYACAWLSLAFPAAASGCVWHQALLHHMLGD